MEKKSHGRWLRVIAVFKLLKAFALLMVSIGALKLRHKNAAGEIEHWINLLRGDPHNHFIHWLLGKLTALDERRLKELSAGTFFYAGLFFTEGLGLALEKRWAEYLTIIATASLLPLEAYEMVRHATIGKAIALLISVAIVAYLIFELRQHPKSQTN